MLSSTFSVLCLNSHIIFCGCSHEFANRSTSSRYRKFVRQSNSKSPTDMSIPFFLLPAWKVVFQGRLHTVSKSKLDNGSPCLVFLLISNMSLSLSVSTVAFWSLCSLFKRLKYFCSMPQILTAFHIELWPMESKAFMKSIVASHFNTPLLAFLFNHPVCRKVTQRLVRTTEPSLILWLNLVEPRIKSVVYCAGKVQIERLFPTSSSFPFSWITFIRTLRHVLGRSVLSFLSSNRQDLDVFSFFRRCFSNVAGSIEPASLWFPGGMTSLLLCQLAGGLVVWRIYDRLKVSCHLSSPSRSNDTSVKVPPSSPVSAPLQNAYTTILSLPSMTHQRPPKYQTRPIPVIDVLVCLQPPRRNHDTSE